VVGSKKAIMARCRAVAAALVVDVCGTVVVEASERGAGV